MLQAPSRCVLWKITSTARKSMNEIRNALHASRTNEVRYWSCERTCAPMRRRQRTTESTTLDHQLPGAEPQRHTSETEQDDSPHRLDRDDPDERGAVVLAEPDVDRRLHDRGERQRMSDRAQPRREEGQRQDHSREEQGDGQRKRDDAADVHEPERRRVVEEAEAEADDDREQDADKEGDEVERRRV